MPPLVRPARPEDDAAAELLYVSAKPYYDAYAGSERRARRLLAVVWPKEGHSASYEECLVAELDGRVVGAMVAFPAVEGDRLARRFLALTMVRLPAWRWVPIARHLHASSFVTPVPPDHTLYVDALAVADGFRRRGIASALLNEAERRAATAGLAGVALDTGLENRGAQALYEAYGFERGGTREAPDERTARAVGGPGFVSYFKRV